MKYDNFEMAESGKNGNWMKCSVSLLQLLWLKKLKSKAWIISLKNKVWI